MDDSDYDNIMPLADIAEYIDGISARQLLRWAEKGRSNGFPGPKETLGKYKLYDRDEVLKWVFLWKKVNKRLGRGKELNHG